MEMEQMLHFHYIFKTIQNLPGIFVEFLQCCLKIDNDVMI